MQPINAALASPSISGDPLLASMLTLLGVIAAYLLLPAFGAAGGFFLESSG
jgi:hypothetical protein